MLFGENLGRSHQRPLGSIARREQQGESCDGGLSASDVALEEAGHRAAGSEVARDFAHGALLGGRQSKRKGVARGAAELFVGHEADPGPLPEPGTLLLDPGGEDEQLLADQGLALAVRVRRVGREVNGFERLPNLPRRRRGRREVGRDGVERAPHERSPAARGQIRDAVIDRHDAAGVEGVSLLPFLEELRFRVLDPHRSPGARDRGTIDGGGAAGLERLPEGGVPVVPHHADGACPIVGERLDPEGSAAHPERTNRAEADEERGRLSPDEICHRGKVAPVLVTEGQCQEKVRDGREARGGEALGQGRAHSRDPRDRISKRQRAGRAARGGVGARRPRLPRFRASG